MFTGKHWGGHWGLSSGMPLDQFQGKTALHLDPESTGGENKVLALCWTVGGLQLGVTVRQSLATVLACHPATTCILFSYIPLYHEGEPVVVLLPSSLCTNMN